MEEMMNQEPKRNPPYIEEDEPAEEKPAAEAEEPAASAEPAADEKENKEEKNDKTEKKSEVKKLRSDLAELQKKLEAEKKRADDLNDRYLRTAAEYDNFRKRSAKERETVYGDAVNDTLSALLPILHNL
ncbi:MAG: nucleotide exchange factor GrpE, partial [Eubacteriales bacterium]